MVGNWSDHLQADQVLRVADGAIAIVDDFKYLGSWIMDSQITSSPVRPLHGKNRKSEN